MPVERACECVCVGHLPSRPPPPPLILLRFFGLVLDTMCLVFFLLFDVL